MPYEEHIIHLENGILSPDTPHAKITNIVNDAVAHGGKGGIVIHFHGGLVSYNNGMGIAKKLYELYKKQGEGYPIFFVWESALLETLQNNFPEIAKEAFFRILWKRIEAITKRKFNQSDMDRAAFMLPAVDTTEHDKAIDDYLDEETESPLLQIEKSTQIPDGLSELTKMEMLALENELTMDGPLIQEIQKISNSLLEPSEVGEQLRSRSPMVRGSSVTLMDPRVLDTLIQRPVPGHRGLLSTAKMIKAVVAIAARVISRFVQKRNHGFHATVVEEILRELYLANVGELVWNTMKNDTKDSFKDNANVYGGTALLSELDKKIDPSNPPRITLVGHSAGAIYISEFLEKASQVLPQTVKYDVVFLAPASTFKLTSYTLNIHANLIDEFRMFTMKDENEKRDPVVKVKLLYPSSLLYFISGVLEGGYDVPIVGMERFYNKDHFQDTNFPAIKTVRDYVLEENNRAVWSKTKEDAPKGKKSQSIHHGDFDDDDKTKESLVHILSVGF